MWRCRCAVWGNVGSEDIPWSATQPCLNIASYRPTCTAHAHASTHKRAPPVRTTLCATAPLSCACDACPPIGTDPTTAVIMDDLPVTPDHGTVTPPLKRARHEKGKEEALHLYGTHVAHVPIHGSLVLSCSRVECPCCTWRQAWSTRVRACGCVINKTCLVSVRKLDFVWCLCLSSTVAGAREPSHPA